MIPLLGLLQVLNIFDVDGLFNSPLLILYFIIGIFMMVFTDGMYFEDFFRPRYYFDYLVDF